MRSSSCSLKAIGRFRIASCVRIILQFYNEDPAANHRIQLSDTGPTAVALPASSMVDCKALGNGAMGDFGPPARLRGVAAAADKSGHAVRDHGADAHDVAVPERRQR